MFTKTLKLIIFIIPVLILALRWYAPHAPNWFRILLNGNPRYLRQSLEMAWYSWKFDRRH